MPSLPEAGRDRTGLPKSTPLFALERPLCPFPSRGPWSSRRELAVSPLSGENKSWWQLAQKRPEETGSRAWELALPRAQPTSNREEHD